MLNVKKSTLYLQLKPRHIIYTMYICIPLVKNYMNIENKEIYFEMLKLERALKVLDDLVTTEYLSHDDNEGEYYKAKKIVDSIINMELILRKIL